MGCTQSIPAGLGYVDDDETDCCRHHHNDDFCDVTLAPSHHQHHQQHQQQRRRKPWNLLCHSPHRPLATPPPLPTGRNATCAGSCSPAIHPDEEEEELSAEALRRWLPLVQPEGPHHREGGRHTTPSSAAAAASSKQQRRHDALLDKYDMNTLHLPLLEPFLGSMYWTAASPLPPRTNHLAVDHSRSEDGGVKLTAESPSLDQILRCTSSTCTSPVKNTVKYPAVTPSPRFGLGNNGTNRGKDNIVKAQHYPSLTHSMDASTDSTEDVSRSEDEECNNNNIHSNASFIGMERNDKSHDWDGMNQWKTVDISRDLLHYSVMDEEDTETDAAIPQTPRRLFEEEEEMVTPHRWMDESFLVEKDGSVDGASHVATINAVEEIETIPTSGSISCRQPHSTITANSISPNISEIDPELSQINHDQSTPSPIHTNTPPTTFPPSPNIATFYGHWGSRRERHVSTLPSQITGKPIRLRITETKQYDYFSYDPYFSSGTYVITNEYDRPYGNGLKMRMGTQFMTLSDGRGCTLAVIKSRYTHVPSTVVYAPKPRFVGQAPSGHKLSNLTNAGHVPSSSSSSSREDHERTKHSSELYPWALIRKEGRTMGDSCTVHLVDESMVRSCSSAAGMAASAKGLNTGIFVTVPTFRGRHGFDGEWNTHTIVTRSVCGKKGGGVNEMPCCVIVRDPMNVDAVDVTIAPGIDPLLMICYLASHSKMDVEPIMGGF
ncbi:hypothetical protein ACHAW6_005444 [Cyclotella cf. meneghiniana]